MGCDTRSEHGRRLIGGWISLINKVMATARAAPQIVPEEHGKRKTAIAALTFAAAAI